MFELYCSSGAYLSFALIYAAEPARTPRGLRNLPLSAAGWRWLALSVFSMSIAPFASSSEFASALLVTLTSLCLAASTFVIVTPLLPRLTWSAAFLCALLMLAEALGAACDWSHHGKLEW